MNFFSSLVVFLKGSYYELTKVTWISRKEVVGTTVVVAIFVIIMSIFVGLVDMFLGTTVGIIL
ncbi:MAG: preprotein translocase subunit SecE [Elusimicrobiota bacterium]|jgi:preprotein translocase subunit SecE|nr:preprotein translocase subunit SecE [Elusimicrobiota bacterium]